MASTLQSWLDDITWATSMISGSGACQDDNKECTQNGEDLSQQDKETVEMQAEESTNMSEMAAKLTSEEILKKGEEVTDISEEDRGQCSQNEENFAEDREIEEMQAEEMQAEESRKMSEIAAKPTSEKILKNGEEVTDSSGENIGQCSQNEKNFAEDRVNEMAAKPTGEEILKKGEEVTVSSEEDTGQCSQNEKNFAEDNFPEDRVNEIAAKPTGEEILKNGEEVTDSSEEDIGQCSQNEKNFAEDNFAEDRVNEIAAKPTGEEILKKGEEVTDSSEEDIGQCSQNEKNFAEDNFPEDRVNEIAAKPTVEEILKKGKEVTDSSEEDRGQCCQNEKNFAEDRVSEIAAKPTSEEILKKGEEVTDGSEQDRGQCSQNEENFTKDRETEEMQAEEIQAEESRKMSEIAAKLTNEKILKNGEEVTDSSEKDRGQCCQNEKNFAEDRVSELAAKPTSEEILKKGEEVTDSSEEDRGQCGQSEKNPIQLEAVTAVLSASPKPQKTSAEAKPTEEFYQQDAEQVSSNEQNASVDFMDIEFAEEEIVTLNGEDGIFEVREQPVRSNDFLQQLLSRIDIGSAYMDEENSANFEQEDRETDEIQSEETSSITTQTYQKLRKRSCEKSYADQLCDGDLSDDNDVTYSPDGPDTYVSESSSGDEEYEREAHRKKDERDRIPETPNASPSSFSSEVIPFPSTSSLNFGADSVDPTVGTVSQSKDQNMDSSDSEEEEFTSSDIIRDAHNPQIYISKIVKSNTTKTGKKKKNERVFNSYQYCGLCERKVSNFSQHLLDSKQNEAHADSPAVQQIRLENGSERKRLIQLLRYKFNHDNNLKVIEKKKGLILLDRRPSGDDFKLADYGPCPTCLGWMHMRLLWKHQKNCKGKPKSILPNAAILTQSQTLSRRLLKENKQLQNEVLSVMNRDEVGMIVRGDELICKLGCQWMEKNIGNKLKRGKYTSQIMRLCGRLLQNLRKLKPMTNASMWDYLTPAHFDIIVEATLLTAVPHMDDETDLKTPSNALKLGFDLKRLLNIKIGKCIQNGDEVQRKHAEDLLKLMSIHWGTKVAKLARVILSERHFNKEVKLPNPDDLKKLNSFIGEQLKSFNYEKTPTYDFYTEVVELVEAKLTAYNRRRTGELEAAEKNYIARTRQGSNNTNIMSQFTSLEKHLMESQEVMEIRGKTGRGVPVIIPEEVVRALSFIADEAVRSKVGINPKNPFLFAKTGDDRHRVISCYDALRKICQLAGLKQPERITSTSLWKYMATFTQVLDLKSNQLEWVINHLGHSLDVHKVHYRNTATEIEKTQIAKLLLIQDHGLQEKYANMSIDDIQLEEIIGYSEEENATASADSITTCSPQFHDTYQGISFSIDDPNPESLLDIAEDFFEKDEERKTDFVPAQNRIKWSEEEEEEIHTLFRKNFAKNKRPDAKTVKGAISKSKASGGVIHRRTVSALKNKIFRMIKPN